jgi:hypothetical protein
MRLHLPDVTTVAITTPWQDHRRSRLSQSLRGLGFGNVQWLVGQRSDPYWLGHAVEMRRALASYACPLLVLEDDATLLPGNYRARVDCPDDADVLFLGGTLGAERYEARDPGLVRVAGPGLPWPLVYAEVDAAHVRVFNMLGTHAVLFLSDPAREAFRESIPDPATRPADVWFAREMPRWNALLVKRPFWYQKDGKNDRISRSYYPGAAQAGQGKGSREAFLRLRV